LSMHDLRVDLWRILVVVSETLMNDLATAQVQRWLDHTPGILFCQAEESAHGRAPSQEAIGSSPWCHSPQTLLLSHGAGGTPAEPNAISVERAWDWRGLPKPRANAITACSSAAARLSWCYLNAVSAPRTKPTPETNGRQSSRLHASVGGASLSADYLAVFTATKP